MATFHTTRPALAATALLALCMVSIAFGAPALGFPTTGEDHPPHDKCYQKVTACCFKFAPCKQVEKSVVVKPRCDFKKCGQKCVPHCVEVTKKVPKQVCGHHGCHTTYIAFTDKKCHKTCQDVCKWVQAVCPSTQVFAFTKFCPVLKCGLEATNGSAGAPEVFTGKVAKLVKTLPGHRKVLGVEGGLVDTEVAPTAEKYARR